jgi:cystathionine beta-lyase family protein involved in aluminum resistance
VAVAAGLAVLYGAVLVAVAALVLSAFVTGTGAVGSLGVLLPPGELLLWRGAALLVRNRDR